MKLIESASPVGVFMIGLILLAVGYSIYVYGISQNDYSLVEPALNMEGIGATLMVAGVVLYFIAAAARKVF